MSVLKKVAICLCVFAVMLLVLTACSTTVTEEPSTAESELSGTMENETAEQDTSDVEEVTSEAEITTIAETTTEKTTPETTTQNAAQTTNVPTTDAAVSGGSFSASDVACTIKGVTLKPNTKWANYESALGQASDVMQAPSCHFDGMDNIYVYNGFSVYTYMMNNEAYVYDIEITSSSYATSKGIRVGSSAQDVINAYGNNYAEKSDYLIEYNSGTKYIYFSLNNGVVSAIEFYSD